MTTASCPLLVNTPVDSSPFRSPQVVHSLLAEIFRNQSVVEIG